MHTCDDYRTSGQRSPRVRRRLSVLIGSMLLLLIGSLALSSVSTVPAIRIAGPINPVVAEFLTDQLSRANQAGSAAFLVELDTPGGLDTAMRQIVQAMLSSEVPTVVYVSPSGARAASAGAFITLAADFAAMAPGTNIGAATPVSISPGGSGDQDSVMKEKVINDAVAYARSIAEQRGRNMEWAELIVRDSASTAAVEALDLKVIDLVVPSTDELANQLDGRKYLRNGKERTLQLAGAQFTYAEMDWRQEILNTLSNPTVAYLLMMLGLLGIFFEISQPGVILPGVVGAIAILLALFAFQTLPVNYAGFLLILLALVLFILEVKVTSYGMLTVGGIIAMALGSLMLIDSSEPTMQISRAVIFSTVAVCSGFFVFCLFWVMRAQSRRFYSGYEGMIGEHGKAVTAIQGGGTVFVHGEYWDALAKEPIREGQAIEVVGLAANMRLEVKPVETHPAEAAEQGEDTNPKSLNTQN